MKEELNDKDEIRVLLKDIELSLQLKKSFSLLLISNPKSEEEYALSLAYLRTFLEKIVKEVAFKIEKTSGNPIKKEGNSEFSKFKNYLRNEKIIDKDELDLLDSIYSNLSGKGGHNLSTSSERYTFHSNSTLVFISYLLKKIRLFLLDKGIVKKSVFEGSFSFISESDFEVLFLKATKQREKTSNKSRRKNIDQYRLSMLLAFESGMRLGEIMGLKPTNVDLNEATINVGNRLVQKPFRVNENAIKLLPISVSRRMLQKYVKKLGIEKLNRKDIKFQSLRHGFGINLAIMKTDVVDIANMMDVTTPTASHYSAKSKEVEKIKQNSSKEVF